MISQGVNRTINLKTEKNDIISFSCINTYTANKIKNSNFIIIKSVDMFHRLYRIITSRVQTLKLCNIKLIQLNTATLS